MLIAVHRNRHYTEIYRKFWHVLVLPKMIGESGVSWDTGWSRTVWGIIVNIILKLQKITANAYSCFYLEKKFWELCLINIEFIKKTNIYSPFILLISKQLYISKFIVPQGTPKHPSQRKENRIMKDKYPRLRLVFAH